MISYTLYDRCTCRFLRICRSFRLCVCCLRRSWLCLFWWQLEEEEWVVPPSRLHHGSPPWVGRVTDQLPLNHALPSTPKQNAFTSLFSDATDCYYRHQFSFLNLSLTHSHFRSVKCLSHQLFSYIFMGLSLCVYLWGMSSQWPFNFDRFKTTAAHPSHFLC